MANPVRSRAKLAYFAQEIRKKFKNRRIKEGSTWDRCIEIDAPLYRLLPEEIVIIRKMIDDTIRREAERKEYAKRKDLTISRGTQRRIIRKGTEFS